MRIPKKELKYYAGDEWDKLKIPVLIKKLKGKGLDINGQMTLSEMFDIVIGEYSKIKN